MLVYYFPDKYTMQLDTALVNIASFTRRQHARHQNDMSEIAQHFTKKNGLTLYDKVPLLDSTEK